MRRAILVDEKINMNVKGSCGVCLRRWGKEEERKCLAVMDVILYLRPAFEKGG